MKYSQELENIISFFKAAVEDHRISYAVVGEREKEIQDIEHELELSAKDAKARARLGRELQQVLIVRRQNKNNVELREHVITFLAEHPKLMNELSALLGKIRKVENYHETRQYVPRVRTDLTIGKREKSS